MLNRSATRAICAVVVTLAAVGCKKPVAVTTYHYDNLRTGWNASEVKLTTANVSSPKFGALYSVALDDQVDTQPLVVPNQTISGVNHNVVYVATEGNTIYAIDAKSGQILLQPNFGPPVPRAVLPGQCTNNGPNVGINGTPVIDLSSKTMYVIIYTYDKQTPPPPSSECTKLKQEIATLQTELQQDQAFLSTLPTNDPRIAGTQKAIQLLQGEIQADEQQKMTVCNPVVPSIPTYRIHALDLSTLTDKVTPVVVSASHTSNGNTFNFNAAYQRQRPALLEANGNIYAGFGSFCDIRADMARGWLLGWQAGSLTPLAANQLNNVQTTSPNDFFLSSIWMSGYGVAADLSGNLYFVTGNSDWSGTTYDGVTNIQESVVKVSPDLTTVLGLFTPSDVGDLDKQDNDYGSGGVLLLPEQSGLAKPRLAAAVGKDGRLFLLDRDSLGGFTAGGPDNVVGMQNVGSCWCGQSYFENRIVASGGSSITVWKVQGSLPPLVQESSSPSSEPLTGGVAGFESNGNPLGSDPGFFTSVSSSAKKEEIIWAVSRPQQAVQNAATADIFLSAYAAKPIGSSTTLTRLFHGTAGAWLEIVPGVSEANSNIVPVVANGQVYVASYKRLTVFGLN